MNADSAASRAAGQVFLFDVIERAARGYALVAINSRYSPSTYTVPSVARLFEDQTCSRSRRRSRCLSSSSAAKARFTGPEVGAEQLDDLGRAERVLDLTGAPGRLKLCDPVAQALADDGFVPLGRR